MSISDFHEAVLLLVSDLNSQELLTGRLVTDFLNAPDTPLRAGKLPYVHRDINQIAGQEDGASGSIAYNILYALRVTRRGHLELGGLVI